MEYFYFNAFECESLKCKFYSFCCLNRLRLRPRVLRDVSVIDTSTTILGEKIDFPICVSPTAMQKMAHPDGEIATAKG